MTNPLSRARSLLRNTTTYRVGLLQAKAYRILKKQTGSLLNPLGLSTIEWAFLGLLFDRQSVRPLDAAEELGVQPPFVTAMVRSLKKRGWVMEKADEKDSRAKQLSLTDSGQDFVTTTEKQVRRQMRGSVKGVTIRDLIGYLTVLEDIVRNDTESTLSVTKSANHHE